MWTGTLSTGFFPSRRGNLEGVRSGRFYPGRFRKTIKELDTLIIDEASVVRADYGGFVGCEFD